jgi:hypothetical protein
LQVEALVCDDTRQADILVADGEYRIVVEADGPTHFVRGPDGVVVHQDGPTRLRDHLFHISGYRVLSVRVEGMQLAEFRSSEFRCWLRGQMQALGLSMSLSRADVRSLTHAWLAGTICPNIQTSPMFITFLRLQGDSRLPDLSTGDVRHTASNTHD